jgi:hypothetical protein
MNAKTILTLSELEEIAGYTIQKILNYPKHYEKTVDNYFDLLFPDEVKDYIIRREINRAGRRNRERQRGVMRHD